MTAAIYLLFGGTIWTIGLYRADKEWPARNYERKYGPLISAVLAVMCLTGAKWISADFGSLAHDAVSVLETLSLNLGAILIFCGLVLILGNKRKISGK